MVEIVGNHSYKIIFKQDLVYNSQLSFCNIKYLLG